MTDNTINPRGRGRPGKSAFYHARWNKVKICERKAAEILGVSVEQVQEWDIVGNDLAARYLLLWDCKTVRVEGWAGFTFSRGLLKYKGRWQWTPDGLITERSEILGSSGLLPSRLIDTTTAFRELRK